MAQEELTGSSIRRFSSEEQKRKNFLSRDSSNASSTDTAKLSYSKQ